jgi:hypothetical protein
MVCSNPRSWGSRTIFWRCRAIRIRRFTGGVLQEAALYQAQDAARNGQSWRIFLLFLDARYDPGIDTLGPLAHNASDWLTVGVVADLLHASASSSPVLHVLRPLAARDPDEIRQEAGRWAVEIRNLPTHDEAERERLIDLLILFVVQRFGQMNREELAKMLQLTPIEETTVGRELIEQGIEQGIQQGIEQGEALVLERQIARKFGVTRRVVAAMLRRLRRPDIEALSEYILDAESLAEVRAWITERTKNANGHNNGDE